MIARTDTTKMTTAAATHHCQSPRRPLPGGITITSKNLAAVGKYRLKAGTELTANLGQELLNPRLPVRYPVSPECLVYAWPNSAHTASTSRGGTIRPLATSGEREGGRPPRSGVSRLPRAWPFYRAFSDGCEHPQAPRLPPAPQGPKGRGRGASDMSPVGRRGKPIWGPPFPLGGL
jgi:hypothetical protein